ncbi:MAG: hypothetical protein AAB319_06905, partial [Pseudomonadota bacterium]
MVGKNSSGSLAPLLVMEPTQSLLERTNHFTPVLLVSPEFLAKLMCKMPFMSQYAKAAAAWF